MVTGATEPQARGDSPHRPQRSPTSRPGSQLARSTRSPRARPARSARSSRPTSSPCSTSCWGRCWSSVLIVAPFQDAMFGLVLIGNAAIGIIQELRAKKTLDQLALLSAPRATRHPQRTRSARSPSTRWCSTTSSPCRPATRSSSTAWSSSPSSLEVDESLLTGESDAILKERGDEVLSGSFVSSGSGVYKARRVGPDAYAARLAEEARKFTLVRSELRSRHRQDPAGHHLGAGADRPAAHLEPVHHPHRMARQPGVGVDRRQGGHPPLASPAWWR